jgi:hypothetical protein
MAQLKDFVAKTKDEEKKKAERPTAWKLIVIGSG